MIKIHYHILQNYNIFTKQFKKKIATHFKFVFIYLYLEEREVRLFEVH